MQDIVLKRKGKKRTILFLLYIYIYFQTSLSLPHNKIVLVPGTSLKSKLPVPIFAFTVPFIYLSTLP
jgi:hypothetical protein